MSSSNGEPVDAGLRAAQGALCKVAGALAVRHGQRQFHALARVQAVVAALEVERELVPWVLAALVTRGDFEAFHALRDAPGSYLQLRTRLSTPAPRLADVGAFDAEVEEQLSTLLEWLELAVDPGWPDLFAS